MPFGIEYKIPFTCKKRKFPIDFKGRYISNLEWGHCIKNIANLNLVDALNWNYLKYF